jgi:hypothetical protein
MLSAVTDSLEPRPLMRPAVLIGYWVLGLVAIVTALLFGALA